MKLAAIAVVLFLSCVANSAPSEKIPADGTTQTKEDNFYHPVDHLDVKDREHLDIDPCLYKTCPSGQICRSVRNPYLLQIPIAACQPEEKKDNKEDDSDDDDSGCSDFKLGVNIFNCRSDAEWRHVAETQCNLRAAPSSSTSSAMLMFVQVRYACPGNKEGPSTFMQASISCCSEPEEQNHTGEKSTGKLLATTKFTTAETTFRPSTRPSSRPPATPTARFPSTASSGTHATRPLTRGTTITRPTDASTTADTPSVGETTGSPPETRSQPTRPFPTTGAPLPFTTSPPPTEEGTEVTELYEEKDEEDLPEVKDDVVSEWENAGEVISDNLHSFHRIALWIALPLVGIVVLVAMCCLTGCILRCFVGRRRQRQALKAFPPDTAHLATVNEGYEKSDDEDVIYCNTVKPVVLFDPSVSDQLAYDMYIAVKK